MSPISFDPFGASIRNLKQAVREASQKVVEDTGEMILRKARSNVMWGYTMPQLGWPPITRLSMWIHHMLNHLPSTDPQQHTGLLHRYYAGLTPNLYQSLHRGDPENIWDLEISHIFNTVQLTVGSGFRAAARHEFGMGVADSFAHRTVWPMGFPQQPVSVGPTRGKIPPRPFFFPAVSTIERTYVNSGGLANDLANEIMRRYNQ